MCYTITMLEEDMQEGMNSFHLQRATFLINKQLHTPAHLIMMWKVLGDARQHGVPPPEICDPWYEGLEDYI